MTHFFKSLILHPFYWGEAYDLKIEVFSSIHFHICYGDVLADGLPQWERAESTPCQCLITAQFATPEEPHSCIWHDHFCNYKWSWRLCRVQRMWCIITPLSIWNSWPFPPQINHTTFLILLKVIEIVPPSRQTAQDLTIPRTE